MQQDQQPLLMDFGGPHGHLAVVGAPRMGRSTLLRTIMLAGMLTHTPDEIQFYAIDFGGGTLHAYAAAPHVSGVAGRMDTAMVSRILAEVRATITEREAYFRANGIDSIAEFRQRRQAGTLPPNLRAADIFLLLDNWGAIRAEFEIDALVADVAARGLGAGVHLVLTANRWMDIRPALRESIGTRLELRLNDPTESEVARRLAAAVPTGVPGRGLSAPGVFIQFVLPRVDGQETDAGLREAQDDALSKIIAGYSGPPAQRVRMLPDRLTVRELPPVTGRAGGVTIGIAEVDLSAVRLNLTDDDPHLMVFGDTESGKTEFLRTFLRGLVDGSMPSAVRILLVDYRRTLMGCVPDEYLVAYAADSTYAAGCVEQVAAKLRDRLPPASVTKRELATRSWWEGPEIYVVADDYDLVGASVGPLTPLAEFIPHARDVGLHIILSRRVSGSGRLSYSDSVVSRIRELGTVGLIFSGDPREGVLLGTEKAAPRPPGRAMLVRRGAEASLVQVAMTQDRDEYAASAGDAPG